MVYKISGQSIIHTMAASSKNDVLPPNEDVVGKTPRWVHVEVITATVVAYVRTGLVGDTVDGAGEGIPVARDAGGKVLAVGGGHTHIQSFSSAAGSLIVTPHSGDPRS